MGRRPLPGAGPQRLSGQGIVLLRSQLRLTGPECSDYVLGVDHRGRLLALRVRCSNVTEIPSLDCGPVPPSLHSTWTLLPTLLANTSVAPRRQPSLWCRQRMWGHKVVSTRLSYVREGLGCGSVVGHCLACKRPRVPFPAHTKIFSFLKNEYTASSTGS